MVDGGPEGTPPVKRKRGRPRKADILAAAAAADGSIISAVNGVPNAAPTVVAAAAPAVGVPVVAAAPVHAAPVLAGLVPAAAAPALKLEPKKRKWRKKKGEFEVTGPVGVDANLVGQTVSGVLDGSFDAGYILTVRVGDSETILRGVVFGPGLTLPLSKNNDVAPGVKVVKRDENTALPASSPISVLATPVRPNMAGGFPSQAGVPLVATTHVSPTSAVKTPIVVPAASSVPTAAGADSNSQPSRGQDSVQPYPVPVPQSHGAAAP